MYAKGEQTGNMRFGLAAIGAASFKVCAPDNDFSRKALGQKTNDPITWDLCLGQAFGGDVGQRDVHTYQADAVKFVALDGVQFYQFIDQCL